MTTKTKLTLSITTICLLAIISVVAVVAVFAATAQDFSSNIIVNFECNNVDGSVKANYYVGDETNSFAMLSSSGSETINFNSEQFKPEAELTLAPIKDIDVNGERFVVIEFIFTNLADVNYTANLSFVGEANNVTIIVPNKHSQISNFDAIVTEAQPNSSTFAHNVEVNKNSTCYVYVKVSISKPNEGASFSGNFNWVLNGEI